MRGVEPTLEVAAAGKGGGAKFAFRRVSLAAHTGVIKSKAHAARDQDNILRMTCTPPAGKDCIPSGWTPRSARRKTAKALDTMVNTSSTNYSHRFRSFLALHLRCRRA